MKTPLERFTEKYNTTDEGCWEWIGVLGGTDFKYGYIYSNLHKKKIPAVRFSYGGNFGTNAGRRRFIIATKIAAGCADCGDDFLEYPNVLDFDHRPGEIKEFNVSQGFNQPWERLLKEMMKCDVVCSNCHRIRTAKRSRKVVI